MDEQFRNDIVSEDADGESYPARMLQRCKRDLANAKKFLHGLHSNCATIYEWYHNAQTYEDLKAKNLFPVPFFQEQVDSFAAYMQDKLWFRNRPCSVVGREGTDDSDAAAKQELVQYQDDMDGMYGKLDQFERDAAMYRICVAQVDFENRTSRQLVGGQEPVYHTDDTGNPMLDDTGQPMPMLDQSTGEPLMRSTVKIEDVPIYRGPKVKRIDPVDFFITQDKESMDDDHPVIIRSRLPLSHFKEKPYYFQNTDTTYEQLKTEYRSGSDADENQFKHTKRMAHGLEPEQVGPRPSGEYFEEQVGVDKMELYQHLGLPTEKDGVPLIAPGEKTTAIIGWVGDVLVRLEETPFETKKPNVIVGVIQRDENEVVGTSLADKVGAVAQGLNVLMGILLENFKQSVNAGHVIKSNSLVRGTGSLVNTPGFVLHTNEDVRMVHKRVEQPRVAPDIYTVLTDYFPQMGQDASGIQDILTGRGEPGAETLGESEIVAGTAALRMNAYLRTFEVTFVEPLYSFRNQVNMQFLNTDYVYRVIGEKAVEWRKIEPGQIRANVDFVCESSSREANKLVITQQLIQVMKNVIPVLQNLGYPVRADLLGADLMERGFSMSSDMVRRYLPSVEAEEKDKLPINQMVMELFLLEMAAKKEAILGLNQPASPGAGSSGGPAPAPRSEGEARQSLNQSNRTEAGRTV